MNKRTFAKRPPFSAISSIAALFSWTGFKKLLSKVNLFNAKAQLNSGQQKTFKIEGKDIKKIIEPMGGCIATDKITVDGLPINYMYREEPHNEMDSGWRFFSGTEDQDYVDDFKNSAIYNVNTIANYDQSIIPYLEFPCGTELEKNEQTGRFDLIPS